MATWVGTSSQVHVVCTNAEIKLGVRTSGEVWLTEVGRYQEYLL